MADYELIGLNEAAPDLRAPTSADRGIVVGGVRVSGLSELDGGADINGDPVATVSRTNPLRQAIRVAMTAAASGSSGIQISDNANLDMGTNNFTLHWEGALPDWTPAAEIVLRNKRQSAGTQVYLILNTAGRLNIAALVGSVIFTCTSTVATGITDGSYGKITVAVTRETASTAGSAVFYVNGVQLGTSVSITAAATVNIDNTGSLYYLGNDAARAAGDFLSATQYNRALSAAEVLSLSVNGPALADIGASQVARYASNFSAGVDSWTGSQLTVAGNIDAIGGEDDWLRGTVNAANDLHRFQISSIAAFNQNKRARLTFKVFIPSTNVSVNAILPLSFAGGGLSPSGASLITVIPVDTVTTVSFDVINVNDNGLRIHLGVGTNLTYAASGDVVYIKDIVITQTGITGQWNAENAQSNTGQIFDSSGNGNHALLPAAGATIIGRPTAQPQQVRWTNTWAGTNELQYIGGVNQAILPAKAYIESIVGVITGATVEDIIIGDGSDTDRYVTITTGLAAGTVTFTLANRTTDGTNLKLTVDPDTNATMSIAWTIVFRTLE